MGKPAMAFSASLVAGTVTTDWIMNHSQTSFVLDSSAIVLLKVAAIIFVVAMISFLMSRRSRATPVLAIERQMTQQHRDAA